MLGPAWQRTPEGNLRCRYVRDHRACSSYCDSRRSFIKPKLQSTCSYLMLAFDWQSLPEGSTIVDVGGGIGTQMLILSRYFKHLKLIVEDREAVCTDTLKVSSVAAYACIVYLYRAKSTFRTRHRQVLSLGRYRSWVSAATPVVWTAD